MKQMIERMVADNIIASYHRDASSGDMQPNDFIEDFTHKLSSELEKQIDNVNNKGNWESQGAMVSEVVCKGCGNGCDYGSISEVSMGLIRCPNCNKKMDHEGNLYGG
jgi:hypothetical protein